MCKMALRLYPPCKFVARNNEKMHLKCLAKNPEQKLIAVINKKYILYILDLESYREFLKKKTGSNNYALLMWNSKQYRYSYKTCVCKYKC